MKKRTTRLLALFLALLLMVSGCTLPVKLTNGRNPFRSETPSATAPSGGPNESQPPSADAQKTRDQFSKLCKELFEDEVTSDMITLHYSLAYPENYGITDYDVALPVLSLEEEDDVTSEEDDLFDRLDAIDRNDLTEDQKLTYDVLMDYLETALEGSDYYYYQEAFSPITGFQSNFSVTMAEYTFRREQDVTDYLKLLTLVPDYVDSLIQFEKERAKQGFVMPDSSIDEVVDAIEAFLTSSEENIYLSSFTERLNSLNALSEDQKATYTAQNEELVNTRVLPCYRSIISCLKKIRSTGNTNGGLCQIEGGEGYYEWLIKSMVGSGHTPEELTALIEDRISTEILKMQLLFKKNPELMDQFDGTIPENRTPQEIIEDLKEAMKADYPELPVDASYQIKYVPDYMADLTSPAFYMIPPIDALSENTIYINESQTDESSLFSTLAHESYPGHLYQIVYASATITEPLRKLLDYEGYSEGWGLYVEHESYAMNNQLTDRSADLAELYRINSSITLAVHALADLRIHYEGCGTDEIAELIDTYFGDQGEAFVQSFYNTIVSEPAYYLKYYVGYLEFMLLREKAEAALESSFDLKEFHTFILNMGACSFTTLNEYLDTWITEKKHR